MADDVETITITIEAGGEATDEVILPEGLVDVLGEEDQGPAETIGDLTLLSIASRAHHLAHHSHGEEGPAGIDIDAEEERTMALFEERFGVTFGEATGHQH